MLREMKSLYYIKNRVDNLNLEGGLKMSEFRAKKLKEACVRAGFTQDETAKLMNLKKTTMGEMEAGKRRMSADELAQFSRTYEVDVR